MSMAVSILAVLALLLAALPAVLTCANLRAFQPPPCPPWQPCPPCQACPSDQTGQGGATQRALPSVSVLVPARNEVLAIEACAVKILASRGVDLELIVLDDASADGTDTIVERLAANDSRVRLIRGRPLPPGWCGKQHACMQLAEATRFDTWVFLDTDVAVTPDAIARSVAFLDASQAALVSGFPRQLTGSFLDWLLLPLIHFVLLGFLPLARSRSDNSPGLAAGCGQFFATRRAAYTKAGGHAAIRASLHDGIKLPRAYRRAGLRTDLFDATEVAACRMYSCSVDVWKGLSKNATEGIGSPGTILPFTILLAGGQILPFVLVGWGLATGWRAWPLWIMPLAWVAVALAYLPRLLAAVRFRQSLTSCLVQPLGIAVFLAIQWVALVRRQLGLQTRWRGRPLRPQ